MTYTDSYGMTLPWLKTPLANRGRLIAGVMLHSTRSGKSDGDDGPRTVGWMVNPQNKTHGENWGASMDVVIYEDGSRVWFTDVDTESPTYGAGYGGSIGTWNASLYYIQVELAQGLATDPFTDDQYASLAEMLKELAVKYSFPIEYIGFLDQAGEPPRGIAYHQESANGRYYGKTDPGPMFDFGRLLKYVSALDTAEEFMIADTVEEVKVTPFWWRVSVHSAEIGGEPLIVQRIVNTEKEEEATALLLKDLPGGHPYLVVVEEAEWVYVES